MHKTIKEEIKTIRQSWEVIFQEIMTENFPELIEISINV